MIRTITSLNWLLGTLCLLAAVLYPILDDILLTGAKKVVAEQVVSQIQTLEHTAYIQSEQYRLFAVNEMPPSFRSQLNIPEPADFEYDVYLDKGGQNLVIRARATAKQILEGKLPPLTYKHSTDLGNNNRITTQWTQLSGKRPGLF